MKVTTILTALLAASGISMGAAAAAQEGEGKGTAPPLEIKKTVDAFRGHWVLTGTDTEPNSKAPARLTGTIDCQSAALGAAVNCHIAADVHGAGHIEAATVIGYSPDERVVRWMEISSTGEYHDHRGTWVSHEIHFEPLTYSISGEKATEDLTIDFPSPGKLTMKAITESAGGKSILEVTGIRHRSSSK
jgi:hypothetical protein